MKLLPAEGTRIAVSGIALVMLLAASAVTVGHAGRAAAEKARVTELNRSLVETLSLTDLALWSEAAYCRHPTQADGFAAWSDHPGAPEHFPAGSLVPPPRRIGTGVARRRVSP